MLMRIMRIGVALLTIFVVTVFAVVFIWEHVSEDKTVPVFKIDGGVLNVKAKDGEEALMKGVSAYDGKDGDLTDRVLVESIGKFTETGYCKVTYAVSDSDNHVITAQRQIHYTDYTPPKFKMKAPLLFSVYNDVNVQGIVGAVDCLDGDISRNVILYSPDYEAKTEGDFTIHATVMNSKGDTSEIDLKMTVERQPKYGPEIVLKDYLIYVKKGETPDWNSYIKETIDSSGIPGDLDMKIETDFAPKKKGMYSVDYYGTDSGGETGHTRLIVIVE